MKPVFVHINKNAGTSIIASAADHITVAGHQPAARWVASHGHASPIFAVIRNPYDRVFSEYHYRRGRYEAGEKNPHLAILDYPFDDWVIATYRDGLFRTRAFFDETGVRYEPLNMVDDTLIWFISQCRWLCDETGQNLADDLLRFESLAFDWSRFSKKHGFDRALQQHNVSTTRPDSRQHYSPGARELIFEYYRDDFDAFGYPS
ncbi:MAG: sulfotransferase family protein [Alphaproteobacteria bacterium]|nr:sulfotransferase family protein [Alphaproteobacteria bacterium]